MTFRSLVNENLCLEFGFCHHIENTHMAADVFLHTGITKCKKLVATLALIFYLRIEKLYKLYKSYWFTPNISLHPEHTYMWTIIQQWACWCIQKISFLHSVQVDWTVKIVSFSAVLY